MSDQQHQIEIVTKSATSILNSLQSAIYTSLESAAQGVENQTKIAAAFQRLEAQEAILDWLVQKRITQEEKLINSNLRESQRALIRRKISQIDFELESLLKSSGVDEKTATKSIQTVVARPRDTNGRFLSMSPNGDGNSNGCG